MDISKLFNELDIFAKGYISTRSFMPGRAALYSALLAAKNCILNDRQYCILEGENYDAKNIARNLIVKYNERFDYKGKKGCLNITANRSAGICFFILQI